MESHKQQELTVGGVEVETWKVVENECWSGWRAFSGLKMIFENPSNAELVKDDLQWYII